MIGRNKSTKDELVFRNPIDRREIMVLGTWMFMLVDPELDQILVGNFDGQVQIEDGGTTIEVEKGTYRLILLNQGVELQSEIPFSLEDLQSWSDSGSSLLEIAREYGMVAYDAVPTATPIIESEEEVETVIEEPAEEP